MSDEQRELLPTVLGRHLFTAERQPTGFLAAGENGASAEDNGSKPKPKAKGSGRKPKAKAK